jgi:hypothetical protein
LAFELSNIPNPNESGTLPLRPLQSATYKHFARNRQLSPHTK